MKVSVIKGDIVDIETDVTIVGHFSDGGKLGGTLAGLDERMNGQLTDLFKEDEARSEPSAISITRIRRKLPMKRLVVVGLGKKDELTVEGVRQAFGSAIKIARGRKARSVSCVLIGAGNGGLPTREVAAAITEAAHLSLYKFDSWKKKVEDSKEVELETIQIVEKDARKIKLAKSGVEFGEIAAAATMHARDLVNEPPSSMMPRDLKNDALKIAEGSSQITLEVFGRAELQRMNMEAFLAVAKGSDEEPYFIHLVYKPAKATKRSVALVGKGITFDSGGLSLKPSNSMETMKMDMAGAATVLGVFSEIARVKPNVEVHGIIATCENMPGARAYRPGDVVKARNGLSIEVLNTDAEGRVTLADALSYTCELEPNAIIDLATLTGSCVVALGEEMTGVMSDDDKLMQSILDAANESGEPIWQLPLFKQYEKLIESKIADVKNTGGRWGGALTAGLFLKKFVDPDIPWAHMDIAGPAYAERNYLSYVPYGGTGSSVRTLIAWLRKFK